MPETLKRNIVMMGAPGSGKGTQSADDGGTRKR